MLIGRVGAELAKANYLDFDAQRPSATDRPAQRAKA
jgi:hypothetical protein